jgi:Transposase
VLRAIMETMSFGIKEDQYVQEEVHARRDCREVAADRRLVSQGQSIADAIRQITVSEVTYYRWRQEHGGLKTEQVKRLKELETENTHLGRAVYLDDVDIALRVSLPFAQGAGRQVVKLQA